MVGRSRVSQDRRRRAEGPFSWPREARGKSQLRACAECEEERDLPPESSAIA